MERQYQLWVKYEDGWKMVGFFCDLTAADDWHTEHGRLPGCDPDDPEWLPYKAVRVKVAESYS
jgi:hypothetical protein